MKKYIDAELQIVRMNNRDIVTASSQATVGDQTFEFYSNEAVEFGM